MLKKVRPSTKKPRGPKGSPPKNYSPPPMNNTEWKILYRILYRYLLLNWRAMSRAMNVSLPTIRKWEHTPPDDYWRLQTLRQVVRSVCKYMAMSPHREYRLRAQKARDKLKENHVEALDQLIDLIDADTSTASTAILHLVSLLAHSPSRELASTDLFKTANITPHTRQTITRAARQLGLDKFTEDKGFGEDKVRYYTIPTVTELYKEEGDE